MPGRESGKVWTAAHDEKLRRLKGGEGLSTEVVSQRLGFAHDTVRRRWTELKRERETVPSDTERTA